VSRRPLIVAAALVGIGVLAPSVYTILSLLDVLPMTVSIFIGWLGWLQVVHAIAAIALWRRRASMSTHMKATALYWGGLAFWSR
jgi:hypothetical protein